MAGMNAHAKTVVEQLQETLASLQGYVYDVWTSTDLNDVASVAKSAEFVALLTPKVRTLSHLAAEIADAVQQFAGVGPDEDSVSESTTLPIAVAEAGAETRRLKVFPLTGDYTGRNPYGFRLSGRSFLNVANWSRMYEMLLRQLAQYNPTILQNLPNNPEFQGRKRHDSEEYRTAFSRTAQGLSRAYQVTPDVFADIGYSAYYLCVNIRKLLKAFGIPEQDVELYLRTADRSSSPVIEG